ncbi:hypothetical protein ABEB36_007194 [Hypothenemus hampei]|uniref:Peptidase S1 domain-containing protein n=1 Tax=Hypothenemus hampei TaxID=57062 RepID=A0ABD1ET87_HYPHA
MKCLLAIITVQFVTFTYENEIFPGRENFNYFPIVRIVGGEQASSKQFPYQVALYNIFDDKETFCGGSLISSNYILTAAHCIVGVNSIDIILGALNVSDVSEPAQSRQTAKSFIIHPNWDESSLSSDIALVELSSPAKLNDYVQTIPLATGSNSFAGLGGITSGWGKVEDNQNGITDILRYVKSNILSNEQCKSIDSDYDAIINSGHLCLSGDNTKGICTGDSGGPLVVESNGQLVQVGVTSFNYKSCVVGKPSVFARVTEYLQWIQQNSDVVLY